MHERCICPVQREMIGPVNAPKGRRHESEPYNSFPRAGGVVHDDALYHAPPRGTEYFDDIRALQLSEEMQVRISRWIFDNNERGKIPTLDQTEIERLRHLPRLRMEQRTAAVALQPAPSRHRGEPYA